MSDNDPRDYVVNPPYGPDPGAIRDYRDSLLRPTYGIVSARNEIGHALPGPQQMQFTLTLEVTLDQARAYHRLSPEACLILAEQWRALLDAAVQAAQEAP